MANKPMKDKNYDLISVVYHASQGAETCRQYVADAKDAGDKDAVAYFEKVRDDYEGLVASGKELLKQRL